MDHYEARFAAVGGQGILLAGDILADAAITFEDMFALDSPTYTAQVRGGPTKVDVILDRHRILFPRTTAIDFMLCLAQRSWDKFAYDLKPGCIVLIDPFLVQNVDEVNNRVYRIPIIELTKKEMKKMVYTSAVALGAMIALTEALNRDSVVQALLRKAPKGTEEQNQKAFSVGYEAAKGLLKG